MRNSGMVLPYHMMTITLNFTNSTKVGILMTAIAVPMPATVNKILIIGPTSPGNITHAC